LEPGFREILINPQIGGGLTWAQGSYESIEGSIASEWQFTNNTLTLSVMIQANTSAEIQVPTTNADAITESGVLAAVSPGVTYAGASNGAAIYIVGSGNYLFSSPFSIPETPSIILTEMNQTGSGSGTFYPTWTDVTNGSLIAGRPPSTATGNFSEEMPGRNVNSLTAGNSLGLSLITGPFGVTSSTNYVTCGNGTGPDGSSAGSAIIYTLPAANNGYNLANITVYGGWANNGRDQQAYTIYYSTVAAPKNFISLSAVNYTPLIANNIQSATRVSLTSSTGVLASNVSEVKFDFTSPASENGYCGYAAITIFGTPTVPPAVPVALSAMPMTPGSFVMNISGLVAGRNYIIESTTNLASGDWTAETNFVAAQAAAAFTNFTTNHGPTFYRVAGY
jgi:hypothetical protein